MDEASFMLPYTYSPMKKESAVRSHRSFSDDSHLVAVAEMRSLEKRRGEGRSVGGLYKRFFHFKALVYESVILLLTPHTSPPLFW